MPAETPHAGADVRLAGLPDEVTMQDIADARGVTKSAVQNWAKSPTWPDTVGKRGRSNLYPNVGVAAWIADHEAGRRVDVDTLGGDPNERLTLPEVAERTGLPAGTVSSYPALYGPSSSDPFPAGDSLGRRRVGDLSAWFSRRNSRGGIRSAAVPESTTPTATAVLPAALEEEIDINGVQEATGLGREAAKSLLRRPELAAMSTGRVGRSRVWPRAALLERLRGLGYSIRGDKPTPPTVAERRWLSGGPRSVSELAAHYGVTISAVSHRLKRARDNGSGRVPRAVNPTAEQPRFDPAEFDVFWRS